MESKRPDAQRDPPGVHPTGAEGGPAVREQGFILVYVLWGLAAIAATLILVEREQVGRRQVGAMQIRLPLETRAAMSVLDYALRHTSGFSIPADARLEPYLLRTYKVGRQRHAGDERIRFLKRLLSDIGMELEIEDEEERATRLGVPVTETQRTLEPGKETPGKETPGKETPGKESTTSPSPREPGQRSAKGSQEEGKVASPSDLATTPLFEPQYFFATREPFRFKVGGREYQLTVLPTGALPNLNQMRPLHLERYLVHLGLSAGSAQRLAAVIKDWVDLDDATSPSGAEHLDYAARGLGYRPRNEAIASWNELNYLLETTPDVVRLLRRHCSLYGTGRVHPDYFPPEAIAAMTGLELARVKKAIELHNSDGEAPSPWSAEEAAAWEGVVDWTLSSSPMAFRMTIPDTLAEIAGFYEVESRTLLELEVRPRPPEKPTGPAALEGTPPPVGGGGR